MRRSTILRALPLAIVASQIPVDPVGSADVELLRDTRSPQFGHEPVSERERLRRALDGDHSITWLFTGDSITHGAMHTHGWRSFCQHFEERVRWELHKVSDFVINTGISGHRAWQVLAAFDDRVTRFAPAVVFLMIGMNDAKDGPAGRARFRVDLAELIARIRRTGAVPILQTPNTIEPGADHERDDLPAYVNVIREIAAELMVMLIDHYAIWDAQGHGVTSGWRSDSFHPDERGQHEMAKKIFADLGIFDPESPVCDLEIP